MSDRRIAYCTICDADMWGDDRDCEHAKNFRANVATPPAVVSDSFEAFFEEVEAQINPQGDEEDAWRADMLRRLRALVEKERERYVALAKGRAEEFDELVARTKAALAAKSEELERERAPYAGSIQRRDETIDRLRAVMLECADKCSAEADIYSVWAEPIAARLREEAGR